MPPPSASDAEEKPSLYLDILTARTHKTKLVLRLPPDAKPLMASLRLPPACPGVLASYYSPDRHAWIVTRAPQTNAPVIAGKRQKCAMCLELVVLFDRKQRYELRVHMSHVAEAATAAAYFDWEEKSLLYKECFMSPAEDEPSDALVDFLAQRTDVPLLGDTVTLAAALPEKEGFVLVGGGFCSHYPVLQFGPGVPRSAAALYDQLLLLGDASTGTAVATTAKGAGRAAGTPAPTPTEEELTAWTVTAAPNMGLACFALGLRKRATKGTYDPYVSNLTENRPAEGVVPPSTHRAAPLALGANSNAALYAERRLISPTPDVTAVVEDEDGMVHSRRPSRSLSTRGAMLSMPRESPVMSPYVKQPRQTSDGGMSTWKRENNVVAQYAAERDYLLSRLILKQGIRVQHGVADSLWSLQLPLCEGVSCPLYARADHIKQTRETYYRK